MPARNFFSFRIAVFLAVSIFSRPSVSADTPAKPNVLFIAVDDLRDWVGYLGGNPNTLTPNIDKLAARGVSFTRSYCASPSCNPSRVAVLSGMRPSTTGIYGNFDDWRLTIDPAKTLNMHFRASGYETVGSGKIYHETFTRREDWDSYLEDEGGRPGVPAGQSTGVGGIKFAPLDSKDEDFDDWRIVSYAINQLAKPRENPLFLACGIHKPHMPWNVPRKYYNMHPLEDIVLPPHLAPGKDLADVPAAGVRMALPGIDQKRIMDSGRWKEAVQGYLAAISYSDMLVGLLIDALDKSPAKDNTIICLWSDHGWSLGEKDHWRKFALWEETTRSPLIWVAPGVTTPGTVCNRTVDLMSLYPTLCDLTGIETPDHVEGQSIRSLLQNPAAAWDKPALTTYDFNNHSVRTEGWRYIRYQGGGEELYNETTDPHEWDNLADAPAMVARKAFLRQFLPAANHPPAGPVIRLEESGKEAVSGSTRDFGVTAINHPSDVQFTLTNSGARDLTGFRFFISGRHSTSFRATSVPKGSTINSLAPGQKLVLTVRFLPTEKGEKEAVLNFVTRDTDSAPFQIYLTGKAVIPAPQISVFQPEGSGLKDGKSTRRYGSARIGGGGIVRSFIVKNTGTKRLEIKSITVDGAAAADFIANAPREKNIPSGERTKFNLKFKPGTVGNRKASVHILTNDPDQASFDFKVTGVGVDR